MLFVNNNIVTILDVREIRVVFVFIHVLCVLVVSSIPIRKVPMKIMFCLLPLTIKNSTARINEI